MTARRLILRPWEVLAFLAGRKSMIRRPLKSEHAKLPWAPGDELWCAEAWSYGLHAVASARDEDGPFVYAADSLGINGRLGNSWASPATMPRWASRLTLRVVESRMEMLQAITDKDAMAEGCNCYVCGQPMDGRSEYDCHCFHRKASSSDYRNMWESDYGPGSWNPDQWVAVARVEVVAP